MSHRTQREIERKYLLRQMPLAPAPQRTRRIVQGYLAADADGEVRLRRVDGRDFLTVKRGTGIERLEQEVELTAEQFERLWPATAGRRLEKVRHDLRLADGVAEVDVYDGRCRGLLTVEVEFGSLAEARRFEPPAWFGREVTDDERYRNRSLALSGPP